MLCRSPLPRGASIPARPRPNTDTTVTLPFHAVFHALPSGTTGWVGASIELAKRSRRTFAQDARLAVVTLSGIRTSGR
jgi:hypothetical protein